MGFVNHIPSEYKFMAQTTIVLNQDLGSFLKSEKDSSTLALPAAQRVNLNNCPGDVTHLQGRVSVTYNVVNNCIPLGVGLQASAKGFLSLLAPSGSSLAVYAGDPLESSVYDLAEYAVSGLPASENEDAVPNYARYIETGAIRNVFDAPDDYQVKVLGADIQLINPTSLMVMATLSRPIVSKIFDNCQRFQGWKVKASASIYNFNTDTCQPTLAWQSSISLAMSNYLYGTQALGTSSVWVTGANDAFGLEGASDSSIGTILAAATTSAANPGPVVEAVYRQFLNRSITIGEEL